MINTFVTLCVLSPNWFSAKFKWDENSDCKVTPLLVLFWWWWFKDTVLAPPIGRLDLTSSAAALNQGICSQSGDNQPLQSTCGKLCPWPIGSHWKTRQFGSHLKNRTIWLTFEKVLTVLLYFSHHQRQPSWTVGGIFILSKDQSSTQVFCGWTPEKTDLYETQLFQLTFPPFWPPCSLTLCDKQIICPYLFRNANMILWIAKVEVHICVKNLNNE